MQKFDGALAPTHFAMPTFLRSANNLSSFMLVEVARDPRNANFSFVRMCCNINNRVVASDVVIYAL